MILRKELVVSNQLRQTKHHTQGRFGMAIAMLLIKTSDRPVLSLFISPLVYLILVYDVLKIDRENSY